jgi:hypothetical protein
VDKLIKWQVIRTPDGFKGKLIVPAQGNHPTTGQPVKAVTVTTAPVKVTPGRPAAAAKSQAVSDAASLAGKLLTNPVVSALLPPGVGPVLKGVQLLADNPRVREFVREGGKAAFRFLARKLAS